MAEAQTVFKSTTSYLSSKLTMTRMTVIYDCDSNVPTQNSTANTMHQPASQQLTDDDTDNDNCVDNSSQHRAGRICDQGSHT